MYIEDRLFSGNTEETLYSVLLDEDEYALYSEFQKEFASYRQEIQRTIRIGKLLKKPEEAIEKDILEIKNRRHKLAKSLWDTRKSINGLGSKLEKNLKINIPEETKKFEDIITT